MVTERYAAIAANTSSAPLCDVTSPATYGFGMSGRLGTYSLRILQRSSRYHCRCCRRDGDPGSAAGAVQEQPAPAVTFTLLLPRAGSKRSAGGRKRVRAGSSQSRGVYRAGEAGIAFEL